MSIRTKLVIIGLSTAIAFYAVVGGLRINRTSVLAKGDPYVQLRIFGEVLRHIARDYVDEPDMDKVRVGALKGLADGLDPYSAYLTKDQVGRFKPETMRTDVLGAALAKANGFLYVVAVTPGSPAAQAGMRSGEYIEYVGQIATRDVSLYDIQETLTALQPGQEIEFSVMRQGKPEKIKVKRGPFGAPMADAKMPEADLGYVHVTSLAAGKSAEVKAAVTSLAKKGAKKLILDLRGVAGGDLAEGVAVANLFVGSGPLARTLGHKGEVTKSFEAEADKKIFDGRLVVLINRTTAGAAEIVAGAVAFAKRGEIVGERSFGAGSEQELFKLQDGAGMLLTTVRYAPPTGKSFLEEAVKPTVEVKSSLADLAQNDGDDEDGPQPDAAATPDKKQPAATPEDLQLKKAIELLKGAQTEKKAA